MGQRILHQQFMNFCINANSSPEMAQNIKSELFFYSLENSFEVLLILTDGIITDMQNTMEALIEASHEPLSIIS